MNKKSQRWKKADDELLSKLLPITCPDERKAKTIEAAELLNMEYDRVRRRLIQLRKAKGKGEAIRYPKYLRDRGRKPIEKEQGHVERYPIYPPIITENVYADFLGYRF